MDRAPVRVRRQPEIFCLSLTMRMSRSAVIISGYPPIGGEAEVVVLAVEQPAGERVVLAHQRGGPGSGLGQTDLGGRAVELDLPTKRSCLDRLGIRLASIGHQPLHRHQRVAGLGGPTPLLFTRRGVGGAVDHALQLPQRVRVMPISA